MRNAACPSQVTCVSAIPFSSIDFGWSLRKRLQHVRLHRLGLALHVEQPERRGLRTVAERGERRRADHDLTGLRLSLQTGGEVGRVADRREAAPLGAADVADYRWARVDAGAETRPVRTAVGDRPGRPLQLERRSEEHTSEL